jgi:N-acyl-D-amino-acid deacylase
MLDLLIRNGMIIDGSGQSAYPGDLAISSGHIEAIGRLDDAQADRVIDAAGMTVVPGFIDTHVHADVMLLHDPQHAAGLCQGVTTEILGQDGLSYAPLSPLHLQLYRRYLAGLNGNPPLLWDWSSVAEFRSRFDGTVAVNTVYLIPHGAVRLETVGWRDVPLRGDDLRSAQDVIRRGLDEGAVGFSTGLSYYPCAYSDTDELVALCAPLADRGLPYVVHLRTVFREQQFDPVEETLQIGQRSGVPVHFSHFRTDTKSAGRAAELIAPIDAAKGMGLDITLELYPYPSGSGKLLMHLPLWVHEGGPDNILARLSERQQRARIKTELREQCQRGLLDWSYHVLSHIPSSKNRPLLGLSVPEATKERKSASEEDLFLDLLMEEGLEVGYRGATPPSEVWEKIERDEAWLLTRPDYMIGSDAIYVGEKPHPRAYGTFPRVLGTFRRRYALSSLEELVNRATAVPAARFGLKDRGLLQPGKAADVVVFNADALADTATYANPCSLPCGIDYVLVNGRVAVESGKPTGVLAGRALP